MLHFVLLILIVLFLWIINRKNFFELHKIPFFKSCPILGIYTKVALKHQSVYENITELYNAPNLKDEPFYGFYLFHQPALLLKDLNLIKKILTEDFDKFPIRFAGSDRHDPLGAHFIFFTKNVEKRKLIRPKLSQFFSSAKLKFSFDQIQSESLKFLSDLKFRNSRVEIDLKSKFEPLLINIIGNIALGIDASKSDDLHHAIKSILEPSFVRNLEFGAFVGFPKIMKYFGLQLFGDFATKYFTKIIPEIIQLRISNKKTRNDFIDMLIKIKKELNIEDEFMDAQVMMFIGGGKKIY